MIVSSPIRAKMGYSHLNPPIVCKVCSGTWYFISWWYISVVVEQLFLQRRIKALSDFIQGDSSSRWYTVMWFVMVNDLKQRTCHRRRLVMEASVSVRGVDKAGTNWTLFIDVEVENQVYLTDGNGIYLFYSSPKLMDSAVGWWVSSLYLFEHITWDVLG